jgi:fructokinase
MFHGFSPQPGCGEAQVPRSVILSHLLHGTRIGIDLGGTKIEGIALGADGSTLWRQRIPAPVGDYDRTIAVLASLVERIERDTGLSGTVGVGIPGAISPATGLVKNANSTWLIGKPFDRDLATALGREVRVENDANCFALSEAVDGAAAGRRVVFGVILGTGVGGGIVVDARPIRGRNAIAGEWGHNPLPWPADDERPGPPCYCGRRGCVETFLSGPGLARDHEARTGRDWKAERVAEEARFGDEGALAALDRHAERLARALAVVINVLDPDAIVLGGGLSHLADLYAKVPSLWGRYTFSDRIDTPLLAPRHGDSSGVRGAAWLWPAP